MPVITSFAQTFYVNAVDTPNGVFLAAVDLCFAYKDDSLPVTVQLCPTVNGFPDTSRVIRNSEVTMYPNDIPTTSGIGSSVPSFSNASTYTRFVFQGLIYLPPGQYAILMRTNSVKYLAYVAKLQNRILGTQRLVSQQPYVGSLFKSQNSDTWTAFQNEDLMFRLVRASFDVSTPGVVSFLSKKAGANTYMDTFSLSVNDIELGKTDIAYSYRATANSTGGLDTANTSIMTNRNYTLPARGVLHNVANGAFKVYTTLVSDSEFISPIVDPTRISVTAIENKINDGGLYNTSITVTQSGTGYNVLAPPAVTISSPTRAGGVQATAVANVAGNKTIDAIYVTIPGSGYIETANITIAVAPGTGNINATAVITGETSQRGGNAIARYMTRKVVLANGFDATDIKAFITAMKPVGTDIQLYYKVLSDTDSNKNFDSRPWNRMIVDSGDASAYSKNNLDFIEYRYNTAQGNCNYATSTSTYRNFRTYAIKICLFSSDPTIVPIVRDFRGIALA
jgi:hypothetical protein